MRKLYKVNLLIFYMAEIDIVKKGYKCNKCGHKWESRNIKERKEPKPRICPNCKSVRWNDSK